MEEKGRYESVLLELQNSDTKERKVLPASVLHASFAGPCCPAGTVIKPCWNHHRIRIRAWPLSLHSQVQQMNPDDTSN
eukprot:3146825-Pleurochrysis_carterae.AAC.1